MKSLLQWSLVCATFLALIYFGFYPLFGQSRNQFMVQWEPTGSGLVVQQPSQGSIVDTGSGVTQVEPGDLVTAVNGREFFFNDFTFYYKSVLESGQPTLIALDRDGIKYLFVAPYAGADQPFLTVLLLRPLLALALFFTGVVVLWRRRTSAEWYFAWGLIIASVILVGFYALLWYLPFSQLSMGFLLPLAMTLTGHFALSLGAGKTPSRLNRLARVGVYVLGLGLFLWVWFDVLYFQLHRQYLGAILIAQLVAWFAFLALPIILYVRSRTRQRIADRRALRILAIGTGLGLSLTLLSAVLEQSDSGSLVATASYLLTLPALTLVPITVFYVSVRHRFLYLDAIAVHVLRLLLVFLLATVAYLAAQILLRFLMPALPSLWQVFLSAGAGAIVMLVGGFVPIARLQGFVSGVIYGAVPLQISNEPDGLVSTPRIELIENLMLDRAFSLVNTRQGALYIQVAGVLREYRRVGVSDPVVLSRQSLSDAILFRQARDAHELFDANPWVEVIVPFGEYGFALYGMKTNGDLYHGRDRDNLVSLASASKITAEALLAQSGWMELARKALGSMMLERRRVASVLHDGPINHLNKLILVGEPVEVDTLATISEELRRIMTGVRPAAASRQNLIDTINYLAKLYRSQYPAMAFSTDLQFSSPPQIQSPNLPQVVEQFIHEGLTNVVKHAHAETAEIGASVVDGELRVWVDDDGHGANLNIESVLLSTEHSGLALRVMFAEAVGGRVLIGRSPLGGLRLLMSAPLFYRDSLEEPSLSSAADSPNGIGDQQAPNHRV